MHELMTAYITFFRQFCTAYDSSSLPVSSERTFPFLVFPVTDLSYGERTIMNVTVYDRSTSVTGLVNIASKIREQIPTTGTTLFLDNNKGSVKLYRPTGSFITDYSLPDDEVADNIKAKIVSIELLSFMK